MQIREIPLDQVEQRERLREIDIAYVRLIARSIEEQGQRTPIDVRPQPEGGYVLIAGAHRIAACRAAGLTTVIASLHDVDDLTAQLIEVDENLVRHELTALDRAAFLSRRKELYLARFPEAKQGGRRSKGQKEVNFLLPPSFAKDASRRLHLTDRWISALIALHLALTPDVRRRLSGTRLADNSATLMEISRLARDEQLPVIEDMLAAEGGSKTVAQAAERLFGRVDGSKPTKSELSIRRFAADWFGGNPDFRASVLSYLIRDGYKIKPPSQTAA